jgi:nitrite reductase/ring-hydroxylating ferredoxin subunit
MAEGEGGVPLCASAALAERGTACSFDVRWRGEAVRAFALRIDGTVVAYVNRCTHVPSELDWQPGRFLDADARYIVCATHGALYEPGDGRCVGGPCGRGRLAPIVVREAGGQVYWYPSAEIRPLDRDPTGTGSPA